MATKLPLGLRQALESGDCVLLLGSGVGCHYTRPDGKVAPDGKALVEELISHFKLSVPSTTDLARVASLVEIRNGRPALDSFVEKSLGKLEPDEHIKWLTTFRWRAIYTTNYDMGLERAYELNSHPLQNPIPISVTSDLVFNDSRVSVPIFHLHGTPFEPCPSPMVITQSDYTKYQKQRTMIWDRFRMDCATAVMLYAGYSGRDPNWQLVVEDVAREFSPSLPPVSYRIDPFADEIDAEIQKETRRVETLVLDLPSFRAIVDDEIGDYRPEPDTANKYKNRVPHGLRDHYDDNPAAMLRLLDSWLYVNGETTTEEPNTAQYLLGSKPSWSLIAQGKRFLRDVEEPLWQTTVEFITSTKARSTSYIVTGPAGYGITTILMSTALQIVNAKNGPVFFLKEGEQIHEGDVAYAATLRPEVPCYFFIDQAQDHASSIQVALAAQRKKTFNCLFVLGTRRNEWLSTGINLPGLVFDVEPMSDGEINRLLDYLKDENALGDLKHLDKAFRFNIVKKKHEQQLLVAMREATAGEGVGFDAIIESEFRGVDQGKPNSAAKQLYLLVCCFYQHAILIRDKVCESVLGLELQDLYQGIGSSLDGLIETTEIKFASGEYAFRARHRIIAEIVWKKCGSPELREQTLQKAIERLNFTYSLDKMAFDLFIRSDEIVNTFRTLEGKTRFFETAAKQDPENVFVLQHFARMLLREGNPLLALSQIDSAIKKDGIKGTRSLHHTSGLILGELAVSREDVDVARNYLLKSEKEFRYCISSKESDDYGYTGLAELYLKWAQRARISENEAAEYLQKAESTVSDGLKVVRDRSPLLITSARIRKQLGDKPAQLSKLREAVASNSASTTARYLLGRAYRDQGLPQKAMETLEIIVKNDFKNVRSYLQYTRAMLEAGESFAKCAATLVQCKLEGESDPAFVGLHAGLLYMDGKHTEAKTIWDDAKSQHFPYDEATKVRFSPFVPPKINEKVRFKGNIVSTSANFVVIKPENGPTLLSMSTFIGQKHLHKGQKVSFEITFSARGVLADSLLFVV